MSYNDSFRSIHDIPRYCSVRQYHYQVEANVDTFHILVRELLLHVKNRCHRSTSVLLFIHSLLHSCKFCSKYVARFIDLLTVNQ